MIVSQVRRDKLVLVLGEEQRFIKTRREEKKNPWKTLELFLLDVLLKSG